MLPLKIVAEYVAAHSHLSVRDGTKLDTPAEMRRRQEQIEATGKKIEKLATQVPKGDLSHLDFEAALSKLHQLGFSPERYGRRCRPRLRRRARRSGSRGRPIARQALAGPVSYRLPGAIPVNLPDAGKT
ncbi:MAG: hypothetical protein ACREIW_11200 [Chthoniobacterales bacterium]